MPSINEGLTLLGNFTPIFTFLVVWLIIFGLLSYKKILGDSPALHGLLAFGVAFLLVVSSAARNMLEFFIPWMLVIALATFLLLFLIRIFGVEEKVLADVVKDSRVYTWIIIAFVLVLFFGLGKAFGQQTLEITNPPIDQGDGSQIVPGSTQIEQPYTSEGDISGGGSFAQNVVATFIHPKVLGMILILLVGVFTLLFLTRPISV